MNSELQPDYTTIGHVTVDVREDGTRGPGGTALYSALQAARLGLRARIVTAGVPREIEGLLEPYRPELDLVVLGAQHTTTLATRGVGAEREQRLLAWAGPIEGIPPLSTSILHIAPVARETFRGWDARAELVGLTPQGLARRWERIGGRVTLGDPPEAAIPLAARCDALVISEDERESCAGLLTAATAAGALVAVTAAERPGTLLLDDGSQLPLEVSAVAEPVEDLGAGDVFAAGLFVELWRGRAPAQAARFAGAAAAVRMRGRGPQAIGGEAEIAARLNARAGSEG